jgi:hypothetical protein
MVLGGGPRPLLVPPASASGSGAGAQMSERQFVMVFTGLAGRSQPALSCTIGSWPVAIDGTEGASSALAEMNGQDLLRRMQGRTLGSSPRVTCGSHTSAGTASCRRRT